MRSLRAPRDTDQRRDPAPTRWSYRYQRLMLTPLFRQSVRIGLPLALIGVIATVWFYNDANRALLATTYTDIKASIQQRPEFMVTGLDITGADDGLKADIARVLPIPFPVSSFDLDLNALRDTVQAINAVQSATLRVMPGGILDVAVTPRIAVAVWRDADGLKLIDADGTFIANVDARVDRSDLPLIAGDGAGTAINEALALFAAAGPVTPRIRALVRMGERRWDVVLDREQRILLPADNAIPAFERVIAMAQAQDMLARDIAVVDVRHAARPTIRLNEPAVAEMRRINASVSGN